MNKVLREDMDDVVEVNGSDKADDSNGKKKEDLVYYVRQVSGGEPKMRIDLCETGEGDLRDPRQVTEVDLEELIMSNNNLEK